MSKFEYLTDNLDKYIWPYINIHMYIYTYFHISTYKGVLDLHAFEFCPNLNFNIIQFYSIQSSNISSRLIRITIRWFALCSKYIHMYVCYVCMHTHLKWISSLYSFWNFKRSNFYNKEFNIWFWLWIEEISIMIFFSKNSAVEIFIFVFITKKLS